MLRHCVRRASRGWVDVVVVVAEDPKGDDVEEERPDDVRRVSGRPGAEGAPRSVALVVEVAWEAGGAMRKDLQRY